MKLSSVTLPNRSNVSRQILYALHKRRSKVKKAKKKRTIYSKNVSSNSPLGPVSTNEISFASKMSVASYTVSEVYKP